MNADYTNTWADALQLECDDGSVESYCLRREDEERRRHPKRGNGGSGGGGGEEETSLLDKTLDKSQWWANGNIICNQSSPQLFGDHFLLQLQDMLRETCRTRIIPDCELFINKRDYPQLKFNTQLQRPVEPYGFIFDKDDRVETQDVDLTEHQYHSYAPIMSVVNSLVV